MFHRIVQSRFKNNQKKKPPKKRLHYNVAANQDTINADLLEPVLYIQQVSKNQPDGRQSTSHR